MHGAMYGGINKHHPSCSPEDAIRNVLARRRTRQRPTAGYTSPEMHVCTNVRVHRMKALQKLKFLKDDIFLVSDQVSRFACKV